MILKRLITHNLYSFEDLDITFKSGLIFVRGENQDDNSASNFAGKSNIFESLIWTLYGKGTKEIKSDGKVDKKFRVEQVIRNGEKSCAGIVILESNGEEYVIQRTRDMHGSTLIIIDTNDNKESGKNIAETQLKVDALMGMSYDTFIQSVLFAQNSRRFSQATDTEIKGLLEEVLSLQIWSKAHAEVKTLLKAHRATRKQVEWDNSKIHAAISGLKKAEELADAAYQKARADYDGWQEKNNAKIEQANAGLKAAKAKLTFTKKRNEESLKNEFWDIKNLIDTNSRKSDYLKNEISVKRSRINEIAEQLANDVCPLCEQDISEDHLTDITGKYDTTQQEAELDQLLSEIDELENKFTLIEECLEAYMIVANTKQEECPFEKPSKKDIDDVSKQISLLEADLQSLSDIDKQIELLSVLELQS